jgi:anaerobic magnesium-protoporphyrin IX monomethyl ester cyclase
VALRHDPWFVVTHAPKMLAHTFRGATLKTFLGLEDDHAAFARFKALRKAEREYL